MKRCVHVCVCVCVCVCAVVKVCQDPLTCLIQNKQLCFHFSDRKDGFLKHTIQNTHQINATKHCRHTHTHTHTHIYNRLVLFSSHLNISAVKRIIAYKKVFLYIIYVCVLCVFIMYIFQKNMLCLNICIYNMNYMNII